MRAGDTDDGSIFSQAGVAAALGPPEEWSDELSYWSSCLLQSNEPMFLVWGSGLTVLFNKAYRTAMGFPDYSALGISLPELCNDLWPVVEPFVLDAFSGGSGYLHDREFRTTIPGGEGGSNFNLNYSPVRDATGAEVIGVICVLTETGAIRFLAPRVQQPVRLTSRQRDCLSLVKEGKSSAAIAGILGISVHTVDEHIAATCRKLNVRTRVQAAVEASLAGLFD